VIAVENEKAVPLEDLAGGQGLDNKSFGSHGVRLGKHAQITLKINTNIVDAKGRHINNLKIEQNLLFTCVKIITEVDLQHV
jgi:hypothetical protein